MRNCALHAIGAIVKLELNLICCGQSFRCLIPKQVRHASSRVSTSAVSFAGYALHYYELVTDLSLDITLLTGV